MGVRVALLSVWDKTGIVQFAEGLTEMGIRLVATGGTARTLRDAGLPVETLSDLTGSVEMFDGRVKTLHPGVFAGILSRRCEEDSSLLKRCGYSEIDMVVCNLYPFREMRDSVLSLDELLEYIDVGGVSLLRAAAKNFPRVVVVTSPGEYDRVLTELRGRGEVSLETRRMLALHAFALTAEYDACIHSTLHQEFMPDMFPEVHLEPYRLVSTLRYGENSHQKGAFYREPRPSPTSLTLAERLHGGELSYNNILDLNDAIEIVREFERPTCAIIKHTNPCGVASSGTSLLEAYRSALACDPLSAYGGVVSFNRRVGLDVVRAMKGHFIEGLIAPGYEEDALALLRKRKKIRVLSVGDVLGEREPGLDIRRVTGGMLLQERDLSRPDPKKWRTVSEREPSKEEVRSLVFAWTVVKHVKSNAIVLARGETTVGIGAGQMSRVDAVRVATWKAGERAGGSAMASDAFFPFRDAIDLAHEAGVSAVVQPGGSIRDRELIDVVNEHGMSMMFTGVRVFKH